MTHKGPVSAAVWIGVVLGVAAVCHQAAAQTSRELVLTAGKSLVVNSSADIERVATGFGDFAEARVIGLREVLLDGKTPGETSLIIWQKSGNKLFFDVSVRANTTNTKNRIEALRRQLQE